MGKFVHELGEIRLGVDCCVISQGKVLLQRRNTSTAFFPNYLGYPGGHIDQYESPKEAVIREVFEEAGIKLPEEKLKLVYQEINHHVDAKKVWVIFTFKCEIPEPLDLVSQISEGICEWVDIDKVDLKEVVPPVAKHFSHVINSYELAFSVSEHRKS